MAEPWIKRVIDQARERGIVLNASHEMLARRHGINVDGVKFARPLTEKLTK